VRLLSWDLLITHNFRLSRSINPIVSSKIFALLPSLRFYNNLNLSVSISLYILRRKNDVPLLDLHKQYETCKKVPIKKP